MQNKIILKDCIEGMAELEDNSVDLIFTSPPFKPEDLGLNFDDYWKWYDRWFKEAERISKMAMCVIYTASPDRYKEHLKRYSFDRQLIWDKIIGAMSYRYNPIFVWSKCKEVDATGAFGTFWKDCYPVQPLSWANKRHPYEDPSNLYEQILSQFRRSGVKTVCDPFAGTGTTWHACQTLGLECISFEVNEEYYKIAIESKSKLDVWMGD